jgi:hypothetical protein
VTNTPTPIRSQPPAVREAEDAVYEDFPDLADRSVYRGRRGSSKGTGTLRESWEEFRTRPLELIDAGDGLGVVPVATTLRGKGSGVQIETGLPGLRSECREDRRRSRFRTKAEALGAVGGSRRCRRRTWSWCGAP